MHPNKGAKESELDFNKNENSDFTLYFYEQQESNLHFQITRSITILLGELMEGS